MTSTPGEHTARCWTLQAPDGVLDVEVRAPEEAVLGDVQACLSDRLRLPPAQLWSGSSALPASTPLTSEALRHGALLGWGRPGPRDPADGGALELHVAAGADAGRTVALGQGALVVGRGAACGLTLEDPDVSRRHVVVSVAEGRVTVADLGSSNGTTMTDRSGATTPVGADAQEWPVDSTLRVGASALRLTGPRGAGLECAAAPAGRVHVRPLPLTPPAPGSTTVLRPTPPSEPSRRRLGWVAVALPAFGGVLMAWLLATPHFLFFALLSPVVAVASWSSDRLSGRRGHRREVAEHAVALALADAELSRAVAAHRAAQEAEHPDLALLAAAARRRSSPLWSRSSAAAALLSVRLGTGPGTTTVTTAEPGGNRSAVLAEHLPVALPLPTGTGLGVVGPRPAVLGVARALVCQLAVLTPPAGLRIVLVSGQPELADWRWCRWLPHLQGVVVPGEPVPDRLLAVLSGAPTAGADAEPRTLVVLDGPVDQATAALVARAGERAVWLEVAGSEAALPLPALARLQVAGETGTGGRLRLPGADQERLVDLDAVGPATADRIARDLARLAVPASAGELPSAARLLDLPASGLRLDPGHEQVSGAWDRVRSRLLATVGVAGDGPVGIDLVADGPHALIAGTTGAGKSELLQTLVASLAQHHPPDRCSFLLIDYKGGAAFGEAAALPHTVGLLTDLDPQSTARALRSLSAELTRRERLLAEHGVRDLASLPVPVAASRLVIVVDEFATLAEELPGFVSGLVGIAQRGRSLGVHLVLATQRPAGVVSPEIRANCSLRICLRTTDEGDARDVLGSTLPAHLPPDRPGRAYLRAGNGPAVLLQVAQVSGRSAPTVAPLTVARRPWPPRPGPPQPGEPGGGEGPSDLQRLVRALAERARADGISPPHRPWLPPLPDELPAAALDRWSSGAPASRLRLGLRDSPDTQLQTPLELDLATGGGWLVVGGPWSGRTTALRTVLGEAVHHLPPGRLQVHVLDHGGGSLAGLARGLPHTGTAVGRDDAHRTVRLLARLTEEVDRRRGGGGGGGGDEGHHGPHLLLLVDGYESVAAQLEAADPAIGAAALLRLARDGAAVGLTVALTAERAVPGGRLAGAVRERLVLPLPDRADYAVAGVAGRAVPGHRPPGRALVGEEAAECQLALPRTPLVPAVDPPGAPCPPPVRVVELPDDPRLPLPGPTSTVAGQAGAGPRTWWLPIGPGGDAGAAVGVDLARTGGLLVVGPPGSGRSSALRAFGAHGRSAGAAVLTLVSEPTPAPLTAESPAADGRPQPACAQLSSTDAAGVRSWLARHEERRVLVLADDLSSLSDEVGDVLTALGSTPGRTAVVGAGTAAEVAGAFRGPAAALRRGRTAVLLRPAPGDAELLGLRLPRTPLPARPGSGWLVTPQEVTRVQVARHRHEPVDA
ncbi:FtsK/SpoIIIE domain-containing protein [Modestobacter sp. VKM Ac-2978]|uniref:FtsK/SpoIIIE domain-containing protein n=1 Tax=Modestobacter sp. VKM Ac-2978 TaxID=3004132 RepID=UPI0022AA592A|nr:FtsK/SpoIIIE domain-containing protein [Modestobacter sp. VKM Ac-2978]MCZ2849998.1 FtsK/SpoIIIE domain-containing protein [Modestobacter sp. VKM Ac-2978]